MLAMTTGTRCVALTSVLVGLSLLAGASASASKQIDPPGSTPKSTLQRLWDAADRTPPGLDSLIPRFEVTDETVPSAVIRLANEHGVLCGLYVVQWPAVPAEEGIPFASVSRTFQGAKLRQILDGLVALDSRFAWREERGVINVTLAATVDDATHPLNRTLPLFRAEGVPYSLALFIGGGFRDHITPAPLFDHVYLTTGLLVGMAGSGPRAELYPPVTIAAKGWTAVEVLDEMARQLRLPWYIVDRRMFGGRDIGFSMGVELSPPLTEQRVPPAAPDDAGGATGPQTL